MLRAWMSNYVPHASVDVITCERSSSKWAGDRWNSKSCHDANFVVIDATEVVVITGATSDHKVGIMATRRPQLMGHESHQ